MNCPPSGSSVRPHARGRAFIDWTLGTLVQPGGAARPFASTRESLWMSGGRIACQFGDRTGRCVPRRPMAVVRRIAADSALMWRKRLSIASHAARLEGPAATFWPKGRKPGDVAITRLNLPRVLREKGHNCRGRGADSSDRDDRAAIGNVRTRRTGWCRSSRQTMLVVRPLSVVEDRVERREILRIRIQPRIDVLRPNRNHAAIVPGGCNLGGWLVGDRSE